MKNHSFGAALCAVLNLVGELNIAVNVDRHFVLRLGPERQQRFQFGGGRAEALGRRPAASRFSPDMSKHIVFGTDERLQRENLEYGRRVYGAANPALTVMRYFPQEVG